MLFLLFSKTFFEKYHKKYKNVLDLNNKSIAHRHNRLSKLIF